MNDGPMLIMLGTAGALMADDVWREVVLAWGQLLAWLA